VLSGLVLLGLSWPRWGWALAHAAGVLGGLALALLAELRASAVYRGVRHVIAACGNGPGAAITAGLQAGLGRAAPPILVLTIVVLFAELHAGLDGIVLAAIGVTQVSAFFLCAEALEPTMAGAAAAVESAALGSEAAGVLESIAAVSRAAAAAGREVALGSAVLLGLSLFLGFLEASGQSSVRLGDPGVVLFLPVGAALVGIGAAARSTGWLLILPLVVGLASLQSLAGLLAGSLLSWTLAAFVASGCIGVWKGCAAVLGASDAARAGEELAARLLEVALPALSLQLKLGGVIALLLALARGN
jgi:Na+/H+-translocating membrane pyrophosphatase